MRRIAGAAVTGGLLAAGLTAALTGSAAKDAAPRATAKARVTPQPTFAPSQQIARAPRLHARLAQARDSCATRSEANFPAGFTSADNLVVGPLVLVGGAYTGPGTVREFGGNKFPLLVKAGHTVTVRVGAAARRFARLGYAHQPQGKSRLRHAFAAITFAACPPGRPSADYSEDGPSGSYADGVNVTFWSGFVLTRRPACVPLEIFIDADREPRRVGLQLGRRCP